LVFDLGTQLARVHEVDAIAAYCPDLDDCYFVPIHDMNGRGFLHLRLAPARNNQQLGVTMAAKYRLGAVAQLGERDTGSVEVTGSSPVSST
jgi:PD-(D/E)XK endonuclease